MTTTQDFNEQKNSVSDYTLTSQLAAGSLSKVHRAVRKLTNALYVIKQYPKSRLAAERRQLDHLKAQANAHRAINSNHVVKVHELIETDENAYVVMDYHYDGTLRGLLQRSATGKLGEPLAAFVFVQLMYGLRALRMGRQYCRYFELENIFVKGEKVYNVAIGELKFLAKNTRSANASGYERSLAPEMLVEDGPRVNSKSDTWSLGYLLFQLLTGRSPFSGKNRSEFLNDILSNSGDSLRKPEDMSDEAFDLVSKMLQVEPARRMDFTALASQSFVTKYVPNLSFHFLEAGELDINHLWTEVEFNANKHVKHNSCYLTTINSSIVLDSSPLELEFYTGDKNLVSLNSNLALKRDVAELKTAPNSPLIGNGITYSSTAADGLVKSKRIGKLRLRAKIICMCLKEAKARDEARRCCDRAFRSKIKIVRNFRDFAVGRKLGEEWNVEERATALAVSEGLK